MTTIELKFPAHRFHATIWGRHVNEGVPEWPPSPYRLVRALYDAWKRKHADVPEAAIENLLEALAAEAPRFRLPRAAASHTRSYLNSNTLDPTDKSLIFDAFVAIASEEKCYVTWPNVALRPEQRDLLEELLSSLNYLGRSESWIEAGLVAGEGTGTWLCEPLAISSGSGETVAVACAIPKNTYREKGRWMDALAYSTTDLLKQRRSAPPALRMVQYLRPEEALATHLVPEPRRQAARPEAVMLALNSAVLPLVTGTIEVAEEVRKRLMGIHWRIMGDPARVSLLFSGKNADGAPLQGHQHAFILPQGNERGRINRILLVAAGGFDPTEVRAILGLRELYGRASDKPIRIVATWQGRADNQKIRPGSAVVVSATPFVPNLHWRKGRGGPRDFLAGEVRRECRHHQLPAPEGIEFLERAPGLFEWVEYRRNRKDDPVRPGYGFRLRFSEPVATPFSLGYGCHFGLGQFRPES